MSLNRAWKDALFSNILPMPNILRMLLTGHLANGLFENIHVAKQRGGVFHGVVRNTQSFNIIIVDVCLQTYFDDYYCMSY